jgi:hypothetical protein
MAVSKEPEPKKRKSRYAAIKLSELIEMQISADIVLKLIDVSVNQSVYAATLALRIQEAEGDTRIAYKLLMEVINSSEGFEMKLEHLMRQFNIEWHTRSFHLLNLHLQGARVILGGILDNNTKGIIEGNPKGTNTKDNPKENLEEGHTEGTLPS